MPDAAKRSFRDLKVWQRGCDLAVSIYRLTSTFPKNEVYGLSSQMQRAGASVPGNIAEGRARGTEAEFSRFLHIAAGSLAELETYLEIARRLEYGSQADIAGVEAEAAEVGKMLYGLVARVREG